MIRFIPLWGSVPWIAYTILHILSSQPLPHSHEAVTTEQPPWKMKASPIGSIWHLQRSLLRGTQIEPVPRFLKIKTLFSTEDHTLWVQKHWKPVIKSPKSTKVTKKNSKTTKWTRWQKGKAPLFILFVFLFSCREISTKESVWKAQLKWHPSHEAFRVFPAGNDLTIVLSTTECPGLFLLNYYYIRLHALMVLGHVLSPFLDYKLLQQEHHTSDITVFSRKVSLRQCSKLHAE